MKELTEDDFNLGSTADINLTKRAFRRVGVLVGLTGAAVFYGPEASNTSNFSPSPFIVSCFVGVELLASACILVGILPRSAQSAGEPQQELDNRGDL